MTCSPHCINRDDDATRTGKLWLPLAEAFWYLVDSCFQGWHTQIFSILHLIADFIDTLWSLFYKLDLARRHADWAAKGNSDAHVSSGNVTFAHRLGGVYRPGLEQSNVPRHRKQTSVNPCLQEQIQRLREEGNESVERFDFEVIASIVNAYQEWHYEDQAKQVLDHGL